MSFGLAREVPATRTYVVTCVACLRECGSMTGDTMLRAIIARGPIICPKCRERHCDFCALVTTYKLPFARGDQWRACLLCVGERLTAKEPTRTKMVWINGVGDARTLFMRDHFGQGDDDRRLISENELEEDYLLEQ